MKGRFKTPIWVIPMLAMVLALGAYAVFAGINQFAASPAEADIQEAGQGLSANVDTEKLTEPLETPLQATNVVTGVSASVNPRDPGRATRLQIQFTTVSGAALTPGTDQIVVTLDDDFQVPSTLDSNQITLSATNVSTPSSGCGPPCPSDAVAPRSVTLDFVGPENDEPEITLTVPDMLAGNNNPAIGSQGIAVGATVTVVFQQTAGIRNSSESSSTTRGSNGTRSIAVRTSQEPTDVSTGVFIPLRVELSSDGEPRGGSLTVVALGVEGGGTATFWLDTNADGIRQGTERDVCTVVASSDDTATCTFTVSNPPFAPGTVAPGGTCIITGPASGCNFINVRDSDGRVTTGETSSTLTQAALNRQTMALDPTVTVSPTTANVGDRVTISLFDYPISTTVDTILISSTNVTPSGLPSTGPSGQVSFGFTVPGVAPATIPPGSTANPDAGARIPTGVQRIDVGAGAGVEDTTITIGGARLTLSHEEVVANQDLTVSVSGFTQGGSVCIVEGNVTLNNVPLEIDDDDDCPASVSATDGILLSSGGTATFTVRVHDRDIGSNTAINTALLTEGSHELKVIDTSGAEGIIQVSIPARTIEVTPASARPRDVVTIIGRRFVGDNPDGVSATVNVRYECGTNSREATADPDVSGNFRETIRIPSNCAIPSDNTITATVNTQGQNTGVVETVIHEIPDALVRVEPVRGPSGTRVTIEGEGFRTFETVASAEFGNLGVLGGRTANTDAQGNFTITDVVVPGLDPGIHSVKVEVGSGNNRVTSSTSFEILEAGVEGIPTDVLDAVEPLGDNLVRVFFFNNTSKEWTFFDPRPEFEGANTLNEVNEGNPVWIRVNEDQQVDLNNEPRNLTCVNPGTPEEDCWNLIVW